MENGGDVPARLSALEAQVSTLAEGLTGALAALGTLNAHIGIMYEPGDTKEEFRQRLHDLNEQITSLYDKLTAIWPEQE